MMISPDYLHNLVDGTLLVGFITVVWKANRALNRWIDVLKEYPPHRHENGLILFPKGMEPGVVKREGRAAQ